MERQKYFLKGREPEQAPIGWEDPKCAVGEWSIAKTPRVTQGRKIENPNKGWYLSVKERGCFVVNKDSEISVEELNLRWKEAAGIEEKDGLLREMASIGMVNYDHEGNLTNDGEAIISSATMSADTSISITH